MDNPSNHELQKGSADRHSDNEDNSTPETVIIINCVLNAPLMLISILGNALVLAAIIRTPSIRSPHMIMLCSLAVSDLLVGLIAQPIYTANELTEDGSIHLVWKITVSSLSVVSLIAITATTVDRFLALHYHMRYPTLVTESRVEYTIIIIWLFSFLLSCLNFWNTSAQHLSTGLVILICLIISTLSYMRILQIARRHQLQIDAQQQAVQSLDTENNLSISRKKVEKSARNTFVFFIALIVCYLPLYIVLTVNAISQWNFQIEWDFASTLTFLNSSINPFLYCWRVRELRTAVLKTARQMLRKQTEGN